MTSITRPGRLLLAVLLAGVIGIDAAFLGNVSLPLVLLAVLLCGVLAVGACSPFAESHEFHAALLVVQLLIAGFLAYREDYVLALVLVVASLATGQLLLRARS